MEGHLFRFRPPKTAFQVLYLDGKPTRRREIGSTDELGDLQPLEWCLYQQHVYFCVEPNRQPQSYAMTFTALQVGITLYEVHHVVVKDLVIQGFQLDGVNAHDGVRETTLTASTAVATVAVVFRWAALRGSALMPAWWATTVPRKCGPRVSRTRS